MRAVVGLLAFACLAAAGGPDETPRPAARPVPGALLGLDLEKGTLDLAVHEEPGGKATFNLAGRDTPVVSDAGPAGKLADLPRGTTLVLRVSAVGDVVGVYLPSRPLDGRIRAVDVGKRLVTLDGGATLALIEQARIRLDGRFPPLDEALVGKAGRFRVTLDGKTAVRVELAGTAGKPPRVPDDAPTVAGVLKASDLRTGALTVVERGWFADRERVFETQPNLITSLVDGRGNDLADILPGMRLTLRTTPDGKRALWLKAEPARREVVRRVDAAKRTITLAAGEVERTYRVEAGAKLLVNGWPAELQDFRPGWVVSAVPGPRGDTLLALWILGVAAE